MFSLLSFKPKIYKYIKKFNLSATHKEELNDLYSSANIFRVIKSRRMRWAGHVARIGKREVYTGFWWGDLRECDHLGDPGVDGRAIFK
jgi:hypothetical protein